MTTRRKPQQRSNLRAGPHDRLLGSHPLVEDGTGEPERPSDLGDGGPLNANAAKHLVLDLHQVARVEELAAEEQGVGHLPGVGIQDTLLTERSAFGVQGLGHEGLQETRVGVNLITPEMRGLSRSYCRESSVMS